MIYARSWMGQLYDSYAFFTALPINRVLMPGSHDSGTYALDKSGRTQAWNVAEQLENGIRYFDFRPRVHDSTFYCVHGGSGPDGTADLGHYSAIFSPDDPANSHFILRQIRDFLMDNPKEVVILKFQSYENFGDDDYPHLADLVERYMTFTTDTSSCSLVLPYGVLTGPQIGALTMRSLVTDNKRAFLVMDEANVSDKPGVWNRAFRFKPSLTQPAPFALWDPYWRDADDSLADDETDDQLKRWWDWHAGNRDTWVGNPNSGFFVLQSHMRALPVGSAEDSANNNNARNIAKYIEWARKGDAGNIMTFDFVNYGNLCGAIVDYYQSTL